MFKYLGRNNVLSVCKRYYVKLIEVGQLQLPKSVEKYETGQLFFHRIFGYRGVTLFPWLATVYDRDVVNKTENAAGKDVKGKMHTFYQTLVDERDFPFISARIAGIFLGNQDSTRSLYAIPGLDYVAQEDILPYRATEKEPLQHYLFDKFLMYYPNKDPPFGAQETLHSWQKKNHPWLELSVVHIDTTENIRVTIIPFYMGYIESQTNSTYWWRICIRLENLGEQSVQLRKFHWRIFCSAGTFENVRRRGVDGQEPLLSKKSPAFQCSSLVSLLAPSGHMWGTFLMEREDGYFDCRIPLFSLESKPDD